MGRTGLLDLERHFAFYGAYHSNPVNIFDTHYVCVAIALHCSCSLPLHTFSLQSPIWVQQSWYCIQFWVSFNCDLRVVLCLLGQESRVCSRFALFPLLGWSQFSCKWARVFLVMEDCAGCTVSRLDRTVHRPWEVWEKSTGSYGQPRSSTADGALLCVAWGSFNQPLGMSLIPGFMQLWKRRLKLISKSGRWRAKRNSTS